MLMMRKFVSERLSAAVEEILGVVEHTVADYQTEVSRLKKEVCCLRSQLDLLQPEIKHVADIRHVAEPVSQEHVLPELYHCDQMPGPSLWQDPTPLRTKEEPQDLEPTELPEDPKPLLTKVEEEPFDISEGLEGDVIKLVLHPASAMSGFCPPLSPDFATAPSGNSGKDSVARKEPQARLNTQISRRTGVASFIRRKGRSTPNYNCKMCGKFYLTPSALKKHIRVHTQDLHPLCGVCEQQFESRGHLIAHLATHIGAKYCHICGQCFDKDLDLSGHIDGHTGKKPFKCHICVKSFVRKENLAQHIRTHTGEKPYRCPQCGKGFSQRPNMKVHMRIHTGEKPYYCTVCSKRYLSKQQVTTHMRIHTTNDQIPL